MIGILIHFSNFSLKIQPLSHCKYNAFHPFFLSISLFLSHYNVPMRLLDHTLQSYNETRREVWCIECNAWARIQNSEWRQQRLLLCKAWDEFWHRVKSGDHNEVSWLNWARENWQCFYLPECWHEDKGKRQRYIRRAERKSWSSELGWESPLIWEFWK